MEFSPYLTLGATCMAVGVLAPGRIHVFDLAPVDVRSVARDQCSRGRLRKRKIKHAKPVAEAVAA
ncbi:hypothetical protein HOE425_20006 [Hoeflea sp. EC-HK425]|nr:hypothetical protein HOE425_20006 [Hoeflea sp. EC-HK425]